MSDFVFSEVLTHQQFNELKPQNIEILYKNNSHICYQKNEINIHDGSIIFCVNRSIDTLFHYVKKEEIKDLTLITNQTDEKISKNIFNRLPKQFSSWYSINVDYLHSNLYPIPLGVSNGYEKNLSFESKSIDIDLSVFTRKKEHLLYLSFEDNTNIRLRSGLKSYFSKYDWAKIVNNKNELYEYKNDLKSSNFVLCPQGNGIDTHRIWEALYYGSIPVVEEHVGFNKFKGLPIFFINNFLNITQESLIDFLDKLVVSDLNLITNNYWEDQIVKKENKDKNLLTIKINKIFLKYTRNKQFIKSKVNKLKNGYFRIIYKIKNKIRIQFK